MSIRHTFSRCRSTWRLAVFLALTFAALATAAPAAAQAGLPAPTRVDVTRGHQTLVVTWAAVTGAAGYDVAYSDDGKQTWDRAATAVKGATYTIERINNALPYYVRVRGVAVARQGAWGESAYILPECPAGYGCATDTPPGAPSGLTAAAGDGIVTLSWDDPLNAAITGYEYRSRAAPPAPGWTAWTTIAGSDAYTTSHTVTGLTNGTEYRFKLRAVNARGAGGAGPVAAPWFVSATPAGAETKPKPTPTPEPTPAPTPPGTPSSVTVTRADGELTARWHAVSGAATYHVTYSDNNGGNWSLAALDHPADAGEHESITVSGVSNAKTYIVGVRAKNAAGGGGWRNSAPAGPYVPEPPPKPKPTPAAPAGVTAAAGDGSVTLSWDGPSDSTITGYEYRSRWSGVAWSAWTAISGSDAATASHTVTGLSNGREYRFKLRAVNASGASGPAPAAAPWYVAATPAIPPPNTPTGLEAAAGDGSATMTWNDPGDASITGYRYQQREDGGAWGQQKPIEGSGAGTTSHQVSGLASGTTYHFKLQALNASGASAAAQASATLPGLIPGPAAINITRAAGALTATWTAVPGAYRYWVYTDNSGDGHLLRTLVGSTASTNITVTGIDDSLNYRIALYARTYHDGRTEWVVSAPAGTLTSPPVAPTSVSVSRSGGALAVSWPAMVGAASYNVNISGDRGHTWARQVSAHTTNSWTVATIDADTDYILAVQTVNTAGESGWTNSPVNTPAPPPPESVTVTSRSGATLNVSWTAVAGATSYNVRSSDDDGLSWSASTSVTTGTTTALTIDATKDYFVGVQTVNDKGTSGWTVSSESHATPLPAAPANVAATRAKGSITLTWNAVTGAASYDVACNAYETAGLWQSCKTGVTGPNPTSTFTQYYNPHTKTMRPIVDKRSYDFAVRSKNASGVSEWTRYTVMPAAPHRIASINVASRTASGITLTWTMPAANGGYPNTYVSIQCRTSADAGTTWSSWFYCSDQSGRNYTPGSTFTTVVDSTDGYNVSLTYQVRARAYSQLGWADWRASSVIHTLPGAPSITGYASNALNWTPPSDTGSGPGPVTFNVYCRANSTGAWSKVIDGRSLVGSSPKTTSLASHSACAGTNSQIAVTVVNSFEGERAYWPKPSLTASSVTPTTATLTLEDHHGTSWWLKETSPSVGTCSNVISGATHDLSSLTAGTWRTYTAYSDSSCSTELAAEAFSTAVTVSNLGETGSGVLNIGNYSGTLYDGAQAFTTGSNGGGYTLSNITIAADAKVFSPANFVVKLHAATSTGKGAELATLSGSNPNENKNYTYACSGSGCALAANTTYYVFMEAPNSPSSSNYYAIWTTPSDNETQEPSSNGWSIANNGLKNGAANGALSSRIKVTALPRPSLTASSITQTTATLTLAGPVADWWLKETSPSTGTCTAGESDFSHALSSLSGGTSYTYKAYSASGCATADEIASVTFTAEPPTLTASNIETKTATLTLAGRTGNWWLKETSPSTGTCTAGESDFSHALSNLTAGAWHIYRAYSDNGCSDDNELAAEIFVAAVSVDNLSVGSNVGNGAAVGNIGNSDYERAIAFTTGSVSSGYTLTGVTVNFGNNNGNPTSIKAGVYTSSGGNPGTLVVDLGSKSPSGAGNQTWTCSVAGCALSPDTTYLVALKATAPGGNYYRWHRITSSDNNEVNTPTGAGWSIADVARQKTTQTGWTATAGLSQRVKVTALPKPSLDASSVTNKTASLTMTGQLDDWHYKADVGPHSACQGPVSAATEALTGLTPGTTYTYKAYSDSTCTTGNLLAAAPAFTTLLPTLTADDITVNSATLTIDEHVGKWYVKQTAPTAGTCSSAITGTSHDVDSLTAGTWHTYRAYSDSACLDANELAGEVFATAVSVDNLSAGANMNPGAALGSSGGAEYERAVAFTTGSVPTGYTLTGVTVNFGSKNGNPTSVKAGVYTSSGGNPGTLVVDLGSKSPAGAGDQTWTCDVASCALSPGTTYLVALKATAPSGTYYRWNRTTSDDETNTPTGAGWSIANDSRQKVSTGSGWQPATGYALRIEVAAQPNPSFTTSNVTGKTATLTMTGQLDDWYYKADVGPHTACQGPVSAASETLTGLTGDTTYIYEAYSDSTCTTGNLLATAPAFRTLLLTLTASDVTVNSATLTIKNHTGDWYVKKTAPSAGTCSSAISAKTYDLSSLDAGTWYAYTAYSDSGCSTGNDLVAGAFSTAVSVDNLNVGANVGNGAAVGNIGNSDYERAIAFTTGSSSGGYTLTGVTINFGPKNGNPTSVRAGVYTSSGGNPGSLVVDLGSKSPGGAGEQTWTCDGASCALSPNTTYLVALKATAPSGTNHYRWHRITSGDETNTPTGAGWSIADVARYKTSVTGWGAYAGYSQRVKVTAVPKPFLTAGSVTETTATLTVTGHAGDWWLKKTGPIPAGTCAKGESDFSHDLSNLTAGTKYTYEAYSRSGCATADEIASVSFTTPSLVATSVTATTATLTLTGRTGDWWLKKTAPSAGTCTKGEADFSHDLTTLTAGTTYAYKAYSASGCASADEIASETFTTDPVTLTASNIATTTATLTIANHSGNWYVKKTAPSAGTCSSAITGTTHGLTNLTAGTWYTYKAYSNAACTTANELAAEAFSTAVTVSNFGEGDSQSQEIGYSQPSHTMGAQAFTTGSNGGGYTLSSISVTSDAKIGSPADLVVKLHAASGNNTPGTEIATLTGSNPDTAGTHTYTCSTGCDLAAGATYHVALSSPNSSTNNSVNSYMIKMTNSNNETKTPSSNGWSIANVGWIQPGINNVHSFKIQVTAVPKPSLDASSVTATTATLTMTGHAGDWWLKETSPSAGTCTAGESDFSHALSSLIAGTTYTYKAYSKSGCATADEIASVTFTTQ